MTKKKRVIIQSNEFTEASYSLTRDQKRILWMCFSQIPFKAANHNGVFRVSVDEYHRIFHLSRQAAQNDIRKALDNLLTRYVTFYLVEGSTETERATKKNPWLAQAVDTPKGGVYEIEFNYHLMPYLLGLRQRFTQFDMLQCDSLTNPHVMRLYETLCQYRATGQVNLSIEWMMDRYQLPKSYHRFPDLNRFFLQPAIKEISAKTPFKVTVAAKKTGRKYTHLQFLFDTEAET